MYRCVVLLLLVFSIELAHAEKPNIVFIVADDLGYGDLGCYGQKHIRTPSIDKLAAEGMRFTDCYSGSTVCAPSRCSLLTGMHMGHARIRGNAGWIGVGPERKRAAEMPLHDSDVTIAEVLKAAGYATGAVGKWGVGQPGTSGHPNKQGFDRFLGFLNQRHAHGFYPEFVWQNDRMLPLDANLGGYQNDWVHDRFTDFCFDFINDHKDRPFFLYVPYTIPHGRYEIPSHELYKNRGWPEAVRDYAAMVTRMDADIGRIMKLLDDLKLHKNTIVFFTSDNGAEIHYFRKLDLINEYDSMLGSRGGLNGWKRDLTDGGIRVPMVVRWPGKVQAGSESDHICALYDIFPTLAEIAGVSVPANVDGVSLLPTLVGREQPQHEYLYWEFFERGFQQAVRMGPYKGIRFNQGQPLKLYDLRDDIGEKHDIATNHPEIVEKIESIMADARSPSPNWPK